MNGREHVLELAGEESLESMSHALKIELNLVLDSSWPMHSTPPCIISAQNCKLSPRQALNKVPPAVAGVRFSHKG